MNASYLITQLMAIVNHTGDCEIKIDLGEDDIAPLDVVDVIEDKKYIWLAAR